MLSFVGGTLDIGLLSNPATDYFGYTVDEPGAQQVVLNAASWLGVQAPVIGGIGLAALVGALFRASMPRR